MSEILIPRKYRRQPTGGKLVPAEDLSNGLIVLQSGRDFARGSGSPTGTLALETTPHGKGWRGGSGNYYSSPAQYAPTSGLGFSVAFELVCRTTVTGTPAVFSLGNSASSGTPRFLVNCSIFNVFRVYWGGNYRIDIPGLLSAGDRMLCVFTHDGTTGRFYINGVERGSAAVSWDSGEANNWYFGSGFNGQVDAAYIWQAQLSRALAAKEVATISANPARLFQRNDARVGAFPSAEINIAGTVHGAGTISGTISTSIPISGVVLGVGNVTGALAAPAAEVGGSVSGGGVVAGSIATAIPVAATVLGVASVSGALTTEIRIGGAALGAGLAALSLQTGISVAGLIAGEGAVSGGLQIGLQISGAVLGEALVQGGIATRIEVAGAAVGGGAVSGGLSGDAAQVGGSAAGAGLVVGSISTVIPISGAVLGQGALSGGITLTVPIGGLVGGVAYIQGAISSAITIAGGAAGVGSITGRVDVEVVRVSAPRVFSENIQSARRPRAVQTSRPRQQWP